MTTRKALARLCLSLIGSVLSLTLLTLPAFAQNAKVEAAAKALQKKAMDDDYLATEFAKGQDKLNKAITQCGADKCSAALRAGLKRDLGVMQIGGQLDREAGINNFVEAMKIDPAVVLDPDLRTKDLDAAWAEAKKRMGGGGKTPAPGKTSPGGQPTGDFVHEPTELQQIRTPIPVYVEYSGEEPLVKVIVRYKGFGMTDWKPLELKKTGDKGWSGLLPCADVQQGTTQYYIQGFNAANDPVAVGGDRNNAYKVKVTREPVTGEAPHLPNQAAPTQCADTGDCPPNFPGCKKAGAGAEVTGKDGGEFCEEDTECKSKECKSSKCTEPPHAEAGGYKKFWLGLSVGIEWHFAPSADDVCKLNPPNASSPLTPTNGNNYYCVASDGSDYPYRPTSATDRTANPRGLENDNLLVGQSDKVSGGGALGNFRILVSADYAVTSSILVGVRLGLALNTYPGQAAKDDGKNFPPIHAEARGTFLLRKDALMESWAPFVMAGAGIAPFEAKVGVSVIEQPTGGAKTAKQVDAWHLAGPGFFMLGGGVRFQPSPRIAIPIGLRLNLAVGNDTAVSVGPEVGIQFGF